MADIINQASLIIMEGYLAEPLEGYLSEPMLQLIKAREAFISIANACIDKDQSVTYYFETELHRRLDTGEISGIIFQILWWNMERILEHYRKCLGLKVKGAKVVKERAISKADMETDIDCSICLEKHTKKEASFIYSCKHEFGKSCLEEWLKLHKSCPLCRSDAKDIYGFKERKAKEKK